METRAIVYDCDETRLTGYFADNAPHRAKPAILVAMLHVSNREVTPDLARA